MLFTKYYYGDQSENKMDGTCSTHGRDEKSIKFWSRNLKERYYLVKLGIDERIISEVITEK
jgi:hypothetical protein